jgi:hypothetical protein
MCSYIAAVRSAASKTSSATSSSAADVITGRRLIVMAVDNSELRMTWGAIRNAQLIPVHLPDWRLRVYVPSDDEFTNTTSSTSHNTTETMTISPLIEPRIVATLQRLGAEVVPVSAPGGVLRRPPLRVLLDDPDVDYVLMRQPQWRLSKREAAAVRDWIQAAELQGPGAAIVHCLHDNEERAGRAISDGLWGFRPADFRRRMMTNQTMAAISQLDNSNGTYDSLLGKLVWPHVADAAYCHDSVATRFGGPPAGSRHPFPIDRLCDDSFVGQTFDENEELERHWVLMKQQLPCVKPHKRAGPTWKT